MSQLKPHLVSSYLRYLRSVHRQLKSKAPAEFPLSDWAAIHCIHPGASKCLGLMGIIERKPHTRTYVWTDERPNRDMAIAFYGALYEYNKAKKADHFARTAAA